LESRKYDRLVPFGTESRWLQDSRRVLFLHEGKIYLVDSRSKRTHEVLSVTPNNVASFGFTPNDRRIVFTLDSTEADIWEMDLAGR
jgi:Tol biopolymer transport system component